MILMLNNRDSFVHNLARCLTLLGAQMQIVASDEISLAEIDRLAPDAIIISPGPCTPLEAGVSLEAISAFGPRIPILGVCLGHQAIAAAYGGRVTRSSSPTHGRAAPITHSGDRLFRGLPQGFRAGLYHSLIAEVPVGGDKLIVDAGAPSGEVMALSHRVHPVYGIQFHPESILTEHGSDILQNFLELSKAWRQTCSA